MCWHTDAQITCTCNTGPGRPQLRACPSEAAYRREIRAGGPVHSACRAAATIASAVRAGRWPPPGTGPVDGWPCWCPPVLPALEDTLAYAHGYQWNPDNGWEHE
jgi:hypothetical protein